MDRARLRRASLAAGAEIPVEELLGAIPGALRSSAAYVRSGDERTITEDAAVTEPLSALARLRQDQGCPLREMIREFDLLAGVLDGACLDWLRGYAQSPAPDAVVRVAGRLNPIPLMMAEISVGAHHEAEAADRWQIGMQLREFADTLVHEMKNPLSAAENAASLLESDEIVTNSQQRRRFAGLIQRNLRRARTVISNVRDLALAQARQTETGRRLPIGQVLGEVLAEVAELARETATQIEIAEPIPSIVVDAARVGMVLLNLITTPIKYADPARAVPRVSISFEQCEAADEGDCWIVVRDNGLGIAPEHHDHIFQRFFRAHAERAEGTGLGRAIVREAVQQLGGWVGFESEPGVGRTFRFSLPG